MNKIKLELILLEFANAVLDAKNGVTEPTLGELLRVPCSKILELEKEDK